MSKLTGLALLALIAGCTAEPDAKTVQAQKAQDAANSITFSENAEIDNIKKRLTLTANPGLLGFIVLLNEMGQPVMYTGVKGKVTSGSKRLTKPYKWENNTSHVDAPSDEGTFGQSGEYIYFWTPADQYIQWNGRYLYSDKPFRLSAPPLVVEVAAPAPR